MLANVSHRIHVRQAPAAHRLVLRTADAASAPAKYGSPPLKPFQPSHKMPAPTATIIKLWGTNLFRSLARRGPMTAAAVKPETPAARWMT